MLVALTDQQHLYQIDGTTPKNQLQQLKKTMPFFCPQCKAPLLLKVGQIKIPHFAHFKKSDCDALFSEGESYAHLLGKQQLQELFSNLLLQPILEPYLPAIQQRPDLLITKDKKSYAIEFQCSRLPAERFQKRTGCYQDIHIVPTWIIQTPNEKFKSPGITKLSINHTHAQYIQRYKNQYYLLTYDVHSETFYYVSNLLYIHGHHYVGYIQSIPLMKQVFPFFVPKIVSKKQFKEMFNRLIAYRLHYLQSRLVFPKNGVNDPLLRAAYELKMPLFKLPIFIGMPTEWNLRTESYCIEWQLQLFYFMECHQLTPQTFHQKGIPYFLKWANLQMHVNLREAIQQYLTLLKRLGVETIRSEIPFEQIYDILYEELFAFID